MSPTVTPAQIDRSELQFNCRCSRRNRRVRCRQERITRALRGEQYESDTPIQFSLNIDKNASLGTLENRSAFPPSPISAPDIKFSPCSSPVLSIPSISYSSGPSELNLDPYPIDPYSTNYPPEEPDYKISSPALLTS